MDANWATSPVSERVVTYRGSWMFVQHVLVMLCFGGLAVAAMVDAALVDLVLLGSFAVFYGTWASSHCRQVELNEHGVLIVGYFLRPRLVTRAEAVCSIESDGENGEWTIILERGRFRLSPNNSAKCLVHALVRRKPTIRLSGYTVPAL
jgi:hypothetical protein